MKDLYKILNVNRDASLEEIKIAYKKLVKKYHPDNYEDNDIALEAMTEVLTEINYAYEILSNTEKRIEYNRQFKAGNSFKEDSFNIDPEERNVENKNDNVSETKKTEESASEGCGCGCLIFLLIIAYIMYKIFTGVDYSAILDVKNHVSSEKQNKSGDEQKIEDVLNKYFFRNNEKDKKIVTDKFIKEREKIDDKKMSDALFKKISYYTLNSVVEKSGFQLSLFKASIDSELNEKFTKIFRDNALELINEISKIKKNFEIEEIKVEDKKAIVQVEISYIDGEDLLKNIFEKSIQRLELYKVMNLEDTYEKYLNIFLDITKETITSFPRTRVVKLEFALIKEEESWYIDECEDINILMNVLFCDLIKE